MKTKLIAEIGINHSGDIDIAKKLIDVAAMSNCYAVKFQCRVPSLCVPEDQKNKPKETPWGMMTYLEYKEKIEFGKEEYTEIDIYCKEKGIKWFASAWDLPSAIFLKKMKCDMIKIPSALITNHELLKYCRENFKEVHMSTGMSTEEEIEEAIEIGNPDVIYHTNSNYPTPVEDANLDYLEWIKDNYIEGTNRELGYSNHIFGISPMIASVLYGVKWIEFHITLDRSMWGSDQMSSVEPIGAFKLSKGIRELEKAIGKGYGPREILPGEEKKRKSLRGV